MPTLVTTDSVTLAYTDEGSGEAVVPIAGYGMLATAWARRQDTLLAAAAVGASSHSKAIIIDDVGHATNFDASDEVNEALLAFVSELT